MDENTNLGQWLIERCEDQNLSWAEASRRAGLSENTISQAVSGISIGPKRLTSLAEFFQVPPEYLFRLAGLLPSRSDADDYDLETRRDLQLITEIVGRLSLKRRRQALQELIHLARLVEDLDQGAPAETVDSERESVEVESDETR